MAEYDDDPRASYQKITRRFRRGFTESLACRDLAPGAEHWDPPTDIYETETAIVIRMEAGGMHRNDFEVKLIENRLHIRGCRMERESRTKMRIHQMELNYGPFDKVIRGIPPVDIDKIKAGYKDGFLVITLPKTASENK